MYKNYISETIYIVDISSLLCSFQRYLTRKILWQPFIMTSKMVLHVSKKNWKERVFPFKYTPLILVYAYLITTFAAKLICMKHILCRLKEFKPFYYPICKCPCLVDSILCLFLIRTYDTIWNTCICILFNYWMYVGWSCLLYCVYVIYTVLNNLFTHDRHRVDSSNWFSIART